MFAYRQLPPTAGCYIATAAARGHRRLVGAQPIAVGGGRVLWVNRQLRVLKAAELALRAACPRLHRALRALYDTLGPPLARRLTHPLAADVAYLALAPLAALAAAALRALLPDAEQLIERLYRPRPGVAAGRAARGRGARRMLASGHGVAGSAHVCADLSPG